MPDELDDERTQAGSGGVSGYGIGSAVLGVISVAAVVLAVLMWTGHRHDVADRAYQTR
ncbi:MAG: hypothetical protein QOI01_293, partial [Mycobacterium sp.]|nr:hypothetical protein [Mycobacterium sp.]